MNKICKSCQLEKPLSEFQKNGKGNNGTQRYTANCKECMYVVCSPCQFCGSVQISNRARKNSACDDCYPSVRKAEVLLSSAQYRANKKELPFNLDVDFVLEGLRNGCPKTGEPFVLSYGGSHYGDRLPFSPSIDRIIPEKGYTKENCQVVSWAYNVSKQRFTDEEVLDFCKKVVDYRAHAATQQTLFTSKKMDGGTASA